MGAMSAPRRIMPGGRQNVGRFLCQIRHAGLHVTLAGPETGTPAGTATSEATRHRSNLAGEPPHKRPCGGARRLGAADGGRSMTPT